MNRRSAAAIMLMSVLMTLLPNGGCDKHAAEKVEIQAVWDGWDQATARQDGDAAAHFLTRSSFDAYDRILKLALDAKPDEINTLTPSDQLAILDIRMRAKRSELKKLDARAFYVMTVDRAWHTAPAGLTKIRNIAVMGERATATVHDADEETPNPLLETRRERRDRKRREAVAPKIVARFVKEGGEWRFDDRSFDNVTDTILSNAAKAANTPVRELLESAYEEEHGEKPPEDIWKPMR